MKPIKTTSATSSHFQAKLLRYTVKMLIIHFMITAPSL